MLFVHNYAKINLVISRDLEQDVIELGIRLSNILNEEKHPRHDDILQQLHFIERLDRKPCVLPYGFIPTMESSRPIIRAVLTMFGVLGPYLILVIEQLGLEYFCLGNGA